MVSLWAAIDAPAQDRVPPGSTFHLAVIAPANHGMTLAANRIAAQVHEATAGKLRVRVHHSSRRGNETSMVAQLGSGDLDGAILTMGELARHNGRLNVFFAPFLVPDVTSGGHLMSTATARALAAEIEKPLGVQVMGLGVLGMRHMVFARPPTQAPRLDGLRMRITPSPPIIRFYKTLGAEPHPLPLPMVRDALIRGVIDGADMDLEIMVLDDFSATAPHVLLSAHMIFPVAAVVSEHIWKSLSDDHRAVLRGAMAAEMASMARHYAATEAVWRSQLASRGVTIYPAAVHPMNEVADMWWSNHAHLRQSANALLQEINHAP